MSKKNTLKLLALLTCILLITTTISIAQPQNNHFILLTTQSRTILYVGGTGPNNYTTITDAVSNANNGDTIYVYTGSYTEHLTINKEIILVGENRENTLIDGGTSNNVIKITANNVTVSGFTLHHGSIGIYSINAENHTITNNKMLNNWEGVGLLNIDNAIISYCLINNNYFEGINPVQSSNIEIKRNRISGNLYGIYLNQATNNLIHENHISGNTRGIEIRTTSNNNYLYHNNILNNDEDNGFDECTNTWDDGYPSGGNYWDDYNGYDNNGDGIGDTPYNIDGGSNKDYYPFMNQLTWNDPPLEPYNPSPPDGATDISINPFLSATVTDPNNDVLTVSFYNASDDSLVGQLTDVTSGSQPAIQWTNLTNQTTYTWYVIADDGQYTSQSPTWQFSTGSHSNLPPTYPEISGKKQGQANTEYNYTFTAEDSENQEIFYYIDWGDQTTSGWIGPYSSGDSIQQSHTWEYGSYSIRAKTKDSEGTESDWSPVFPISMPHLKMYEIIQINYPHMIRILTIIYQLMNIQ